MNKTEKLIVAVLAVMLIAWFWRNVTSHPEVENTPSNTAVQTVATNPAPASEAVKVEEVNLDLLKASLPAEETVVLSNELESVVLSTHGAVIKSVVLHKFATDLGEVSADNPPVKFDFTKTPALAENQTAAWKIVSKDEASVVFELDGRTRKISLGNDYLINVADSATPSILTIGAMGIGNSKNDILSVDSWSLTAGNGKVVHWGETDPLKGFLTGGVGGCGAGGCGGKPDASMVPLVNKVSIPGDQRWLAVKNRFFVAALAKSSAKVIGFDAVMTREQSQEYRLKNVAVTARFDASNEAVEYSLFIGPKKQSLLWALDMKDVMEFGMWRWVCYPMVWVLNLFNSWIPSYGIAIILLTFLVRIVFWPLTHRSTVGMRRMQEIQPKLKEIQARCKDNPQKLQQETWACYRENKVNPMSSCLPMLVQIPVFIALFTVLRSAVELRYAPFLWIADLSEPENLFPGIFPFGGLNILPILMALTMGLQSWLTPSAGDKQQQKMMMVFMPVMMLVMFYSFPSALSLYWTLSQVISIVQMWWIRRRYTPAPVAAGVEVVDAPVTRQMRRHGK